MIIQFRRYFIVLKEELKFGVRRTIHFFYPWTALNAIDKKLLKHIQKRDGVYLEAGANDGIRQSNTFYLERRRGWTGVLVEPLPRLASRCRRVRRRSLTVEVALVSPSSTGEPIEMFDLDLMSVVPERNSGIGDLNQHVESAESVQGISRAVATVDARTISEVIEMAQVGEVDLLSLDVEGYELQALEGLNLDLHAPEWILIETRTFDQVNEILRGRYSLADQLSHHDFLFRRI